MRTVSRYAQGLSQSEHAAVPSVAKNAKVRTGRITRRLGTPPARMAMISPSLDMRLSPMSTPAREPRGRARVSTAGSKRAKR